MYIEIKVVNNEGSIIDISRISVAFPLIIKDWHKTPIILERLNKRVKLLVGYEIKPTTIWMNESEL